MPKSSRWVAVALGLSLAVVGIFGPWQQPDVARSSTSSTVVVNANRTGVDWFLDNFWDDTGLHVSAGDQIMITASGTWSHQGGVVPEYDANGFTSLASVCYPGYRNDLGTQVSHVGQLVGRIFPDPDGDGDGDLAIPAGGDGVRFSNDTCDSNLSTPSWVPIPIGSSFSGTAEVTGYLQLAFNGDTYEPTNQRFSDNSGAVTVEIEIVPAAAPAVFLVIDEDSIDNGTDSIEIISFNAPNCGAGDPAICVNDDVADPAQRALLFTRGNDVTPFDGLELPTGEIGDEGLFEFTDPDPQISLQNGATFTTAEFVAATGAAADENNLDKIAGVAPLGEAEITGLVGKTVCAAVYDSDVSVDVAAGFGSLKGSTLGLTAFHVTAVSPSPAGGSSLPLITVDLLPSSDVQAVCDSAAPADEGKIAFRSPRDGNEEIYSMNPDGTGVTRLTFNPAHDDHPDWSPDGSQIAFLSLRDGNQEIYVMNADGSNTVRITNSTALDAHPAWSPDGTKIAFESNGSGVYQIHVMDSDGTGVTALTASPGANHEPRWSPDGTRILFYSSRDEPSFEIYVMNADGSGVTRLTNNTVTDKEGSWSPDGANIAFTSDRDGNPEIYVMNADGSAVTRLTDNTTNDSSPSWSPDGMRIATQANRDGNAEIYVMDADGSNQVNITNNPASEAEPAWGRTTSAIGPTKIAFFSDRDAGDREIYLMNADGSDQVNLTSSPGRDQSPSISPDGTKIAFESQRGGVPDEIYVMNIDGSGVTRLTFNGNDESSASWCTNDRITFASIRDGQWEIYIMDSDGSNQTRLTFTGAHETTVACSFDGTRIAFDSARDGDTEIYVMDADGQGQTRLTDRPGNNSTPEWSPDGSMISWGCEVPGSLDICVMNADGTGQVNITGGTFLDSAPAAWSPDGTKLAFHSFDRDGDVEIYTMNPDGSEVQRITDSPGVDGGASWGPGP